MKKQIFAALALLALTVLPMAGAYAQDMDGDNDVRLDTDNDFDIRPYAGAGLGAFGLEFKNSTTSIKKTVFGGYGKLGADIGDYLGVELRIGGTASGTKNTTKIQASSFYSYLGKIQFPATPDFRLYALLGGTTARFKKGGLSKTKTGFSYGFGADYYLQDRVSVGGEWVQYWTNVKLGSTFGTGAEAKIWGAVATASYHF